LEKKNLHILDNPNIHRPFIIVFALLLFLPFLGSVHLFDWDEINFAEAAREMIVTNNFLRVQIDFQPFWEKPPLFMWLQVLSMKVFGVNEFAARLVNALFGMCTLLFVYETGKRLFNARFGLLWALFFTGSFLPHIFFKSGIIDPVFNLFIFAGITLIATLVQGNQKKRTIKSIIAGILIGFAVLTKGPVGFLLVFLTTVSVWLFKKRTTLITRKEMVLFFSAFCGVNVLFYGLETLLHGTWFIEEFIRYHIRLLTTGDSGHGRFFLFHFVVVLFGCFPASVFALRALFTASPSQTPQQENYLTWMRALFWVVMILFSIVKTKTVLYSSLSYFPITFLAAWEALALIEKRRHWHQAQTITLSIFSLINTAVIIGLPALMVNRAWLVSKISKEFTRANLMRPGDWHYGLLWVGIVYGIVTFTTIACISRKNIRMGILSLLISSAFLIQWFTITFTGRIENHTQRAFIEFYQSLQGKDVYVKSLFKSYAPFFYTRKKPTNNARSSDKTWLLTGPIDKPVYFVHKTHKSKQLAATYNLVHLKDDGGFSFFRRDPVPEPPDSTSTSP